MAMRKGVRGRGVIRGNQRKYKAQIGKIIRFFPINVVSGVHIILD